MSEEDRERRQHEIRKLQKEYAHWLSVKVRLEKMLHVKKARLMKAAMQAGVSSTSAQEREAYAHPEYEEMVEGLAVAVEESTERWLIIEERKRQFEEWRTKQANQRAERDRYGA